MNETNDLQNFERPTSEIIQSSIQHIIEGLTGLASSSREDVILSIGHIFQRMRSGQFLSNLQKEWDSFREKGKIKDDYQYTEQHYSCLSEILNFLDTEIPDEQRFNVLKKIFLISSTEKHSDRLSILPYHYLRVARNLSAGEISVLFATYQKYKEGNWQDNGNVTVLYWISEIQIKSGLDIKELVEIYEETLIQKKLLTQRKYADESGVTLKPYFRLSDLGFKFCEFISFYESEV